MLFVPGGGFGFGNIQTNVPGQPVATGGAAVTPVVGSKGSYTEVFAALSNDTYGLMVLVHNSRTSAANRQIVLDIAIGAAGSEQVILPDLLVSNASLINGTGGVWYYFPIFVPAGTRVAARAQSNSTTACRVIVRAMQQPLEPAMLRTCRHVEAIGITGITPTTCNPGTTSEGSWVLLGTTSRDLWWWQMGIQSSSATMSATLSHYDLAVGDGTNFQIIMQDVPFATASDEQSSKPLFVMGCERFVSAGSSIYARGQSDTSFSPFQVCAYGGF